MLHRNLFLKYKLHHLCFWLLVFGIWYFLRYEDYPDSAKAFQVTFIKLLDLVIMIYLTNYVLIPQLLYKKKYVGFTVIFVLMIVTSCIIKMSILANLLNEPLQYGLSNNLKARIYNNVVPHFFLVTAGAAVKLMLDYGQLQKRIAEIAREKAVAELNFLKSQINPHFLFNSLNSVYFLIDKNNSAAREALHKFSDMLRYQLYEMNGDKIPIEKEISYLNDYMDLQKLRKDENYSVQLNSTPEVKGFLIEPLLLIPFVENAFKHISHRKGETNFIKLDMSRHNGEFQFMIENSKDALNRTTEKAGGIGLNNVKRRLELLYPGKHQLKINDQADLYTIDLKLTI
jgi:two-component system, LytTR family, sensor kinase